MTSSSLRVIPLGGLGEIGKNMMALEYGDDIIVIDCGLSFPTEDMPGVDLVIPDISYLIKNRCKIRGILITHGHEDHTGALPFVLPHLQVPVFASSLAYNLISVKLKDRKIYDGVTLHVIKPDVPISLGNFKVEAFSVSHSIPDAMGFAIRTPVGLIIHTGDFKIDHSPIDGIRTDLAKLARYGQEGVTLLLSDSTYAELEGYTPSEQVVGKALDRVVAEAPGRVLVATFASLISRIQQIIDAAAHHDRKVAILGRRMVENVTMATKMGYIKVPDGVLISPSQATKLPNSQVVVVTTGSQGEPTSALVRMAKGEHRQIEVVSGDTVVISATAIPGNERMVYRTINDLTRRGAKVIYDKIALVHVHGHGAQEELKTVLSLTKPRFFVPIHGEYKGLVAHAAIAQLMGVHKDHTFVLEDGDVFEIGPNVGEVTGKVSAGYVYVDGKGTICSNSLVLRDRRQLSRDGVVVIVVNCDKENGNILANPVIFSSGFVEKTREPDLFDEVSRRIRDVIVNEKQLPVHSANLNEKVKELAGKILYKSTGSQPMIVSVTQWV